MTTPHARILERTDDTYRRELTVPDAYVLEGQPVQLSWAYKDLIAAPVRFGTWACSPGQMRIDHYPADELFTLVEGEVVLEHVDGTVTRVLPGMTCLLPQGWRGTWQTVRPAFKSFIASEAG